MSTWILQTIYDSDSAYQADKDSLRKHIEAHSPDLKTRITSLQEAGMLLQELEAYIECRMAQQTDDRGAQAEKVSLNSLRVLYEGGLFDLGAQLEDLDEPAFQNLIEELPEISFFLKELRHLAAKRGSEGQEKVIQALVSDGYHAYWSLYQSFTGKMRIGDLSVSQAYNLLSDPDRKIREQAFADWSKAWEKESDFLAQILNHLAGFRLGVYGVRGWDSILHEPLAMNRMEEATLNSMLNAINEAKPMLIRYLEKKAQLLGLKKLSWFDVESPLNGATLSTWESACDTIVSAFQAFHPQKAAFVRECFDKKWIDAEDREGKAAGGFCLQFPKSKQSRIFMTYKGTPINVATLAHELGHAYHNRCVEHLPYFHQQMQMNVAETASTFGEMVVIDQSIANCSTDKERRFLLDDKLQRTVVYFMNLQARLLFEKAFYAERKKGFVTADRLSKLMVEAQKEAFGDALADWDPLFWASKLHFFYTDYPFYNFPYTFGYLLSNGLYARAKEGGFGSRFDAFLVDTAQMTVEDLAQKHLGVDLRTPSFWRESVGILVQDIETFLSL